MKKIKKNHINLQKSLEKIKQAVKNEDRPELEKIMKHATYQKMKWLME